jgi:osmoprotectant transport system substrate-binding protein
MPLAAQTMSMRLPAGTRLTTRSALPFLILVVAVIAAASACSGRGARPALPVDPRHPTIRVASFDFVESQILAELYGQALSHGGYPVEAVRSLGPREIVEPALQQGKVDLIPEYLGSALDFLHQGERVATADAAHTRALLAQAFQANGITVLAYARAQDQNGIVVTRQFAAAHRLRRISDLASLAQELSFGGPPECAQRLLCLKGLQGMYGLAFKPFVSMPSFTVTAAALQQEQIDVGMIVTTDGSLATSGLVLLDDDRHLQPAENVVPVIRERIVAAYGTSLTRLLDAVTAQLTTRDLIGLNQQAEQGGSPQALAADWLRRHGFTG